MKTVWRVKYWYGEHWEEVGLYTTKELAEKYKERYLKGKSVHFREYTQVWEEKVYHS